MNSPYLGLVQTRFSLPVFRWDRMAVQQRILIILIQLLVLWGALLWNLGELTLLEVVLNSLAPHLKVSILNRHLIHDNFFFIVTSVRRL